MGYKKSDITKRKILDEAKALFIKKGYYHTEIKEIAAQAQVAHTAIYYYYPNKEAIASQIYEDETNKIVAAMLHIRDNVCQDTLTLFILQYLLLFEHLAMNPATQTYYFDMLHYEKYDLENIHRVNNSFYYLLHTLFEERNGSLKDEKMVAYILTSDAYVKALLMGIKNGLLSYSNEDVLDDFFHHLILQDLKIEKQEYDEKKMHALELAEITRTSFQ